MTKLKEQILRKIIYYTQVKNSEKLRKYQREKWAIIGMYDHNFEFQTVVHVHARFVRLDMVPTHYNYPDFYLYYWWAMIIWTLDHKFKFVDH